MKKYLPSKQFCIFFGITIAIGVIVFFGLRLINARTRVSQNIQSIATRQIIEELDTDNDGVKDWEEGLWGLDANNPDTDGDGILDGQEVEARKREIQNSDDFVDVLEEPKTETERLARQLITVALNINQATGGQISQEELANVVSGFVTGIEPSLFTPYQLSDIRISQTQTAQNYYQEMTKTIGYLSRYQGTELGIFERAISSNKEKIVKELEPIIIAYSEAPKKVLDKEIPSQIAKAHVDYLNALNQKAVALFSLIQYFKDPIIAVRGINEYVIAEQNLTDASDSIKSYLQNNGIVN